MNKSNISPVTNVFHPILSLFLVLGFAAPLAAAVAPSHPGAPADGAFEGRRGGDHPLGTAILNVDTGETFATLQAAIDDPDTDAGDTLEVQVASHSEGQILVNKSLTLRGATGSEVVRMAVNTGNSGDNRAWFLVDTGIDLQVLDLTFDGDGFLVHQAFRHKGTGSFQNCAFRDIRFNESGPDYAGTAIVAFGGDVDVRDCAFEQIGRVGVLAFGAGLTGSVIENNAYTGKGDGDFLDYGFEVGAGAAATLRGNAVTDCRGVASSDGSTSAALLVSTFFGAGTAATVESNTLLASTTGLQVGRGSDTSVVDAAFNRVVGNANGADSVSPTVVSENNWWGCNAGPGAAGCDTATGTQDFDPWLVLGVAADPTMVSPGGTSDVTASLIVNSDGADTSGAGTVPDGIPVDFAATLGTIAPPTAGTLAGFAAAIYTAGATLGTGGASATVDGETVSADIEILPTGGTGTGVFAIPTLGPAGLATLLALLAAAALWRLRRRRA